MDWESLKEAYKRFRELDDAPIVFVLHPDHFLLRDEAQRPMPAKHSETLKTRNAYHRGMKPKCNKLIGEITAKEDSNVVIAVECNEKEGHEPPCRYFRTDIDGMVIVIVATERKN